MRALALVLLLACHPSASVERTTPVANLQTYRTLALRVHASDRVSGDVTGFMESSVLDRLRRTCGFEQVGPASDTPSDMVLDLNITNSSRGGTGWIQNQNQVFIDTLLVISDGQDGEPLGTATIHGKSSGTLINGRSPENEAVEVIAKTIGDLLAKSGCTGPRIARAPVAPPVETGPTGQGSATAPVDESRRAEAEALNDKGKEKLFAADLAGALQLFQQANALLPDPKYQFNVCVALGAQEHWDDAIAACTQARSMNPPAKLAAKIDQRLDGLRNHQ